MYVQSSYWSLNFLESHGISGNLENVMEFHIFMSYTIVTKLNLYSTHCHTV